MSEGFVTNITILAKYLDWTVNDKLLNFSHNVDGEAQPVGFVHIDRYAGGNANYSAHIWSAASNYVDGTYKDNLFNILKGNADDCYLYEQCEDMIARVYALDTWGWRRISDTD